MTPPAPPVPSPCSSKQFTCSNGDCVHLDRRCDLQRDCADGSDERDCGKTQAGENTNKAVKYSDVSIIHCRLFASRPSGLHHVTVDSLECVQCLLWSGLIVPPEGLTPGSPARRGLWRSSLRQSSLLPASMSR